MDEDEFGFDVNDYVSEQGRYDYDDQEDLENAYNDEDERW